MYSESPNEVLLGGVSGRQCIREGVTNVSDTILTDIRGSSAECTQ
jgi:hypothetical protein